jgi:predicted HTH domain antitoxin
VKSFSGLGILGIVQIVVNLPEDIAQHANPGRDALEALAIEGYRAGSLTHFQARQMLGLSRFDFDRFLTERGVVENAYDRDDLERDIATIERLDRNTFFPSDGR